MDDLDWETIAIPVSALAIGYVASLFVSGLLVWVVFFGWIVLCCGRKKNPHDR
jgi:hypothetical protein